MKKRAIDNKIISMFLAVLLAFSMISPTAFAEEILHTETDDEPQTISSMEQDIFDLMSEQEINHEDTYQSDLASENYYVDTSDILSAESVVKLYNMGYLPEDIKIASKISEDSDKSAYEILQTKGITNYVLADESDKDTVTREELSLDEVEFIKEEKAWDTVCEELEISQETLQNSVMDLDEQSGSYDDTKQIDEDKNSSGLLTQIQASALPASYYSDNSDFYGDYVYPNSINSIFNTQGYSYSGNAAVNSATGNVVVSETDLSLKGRNGLDLNLTRIYSLSHATTTTPAAYAQVAGVATGMYYYVSCIVNVYKNSSQNVTSTYSAKVARGVDGNYRLSFNQDDIIPNDCLYSYSGADMVVKAVNNKELDGIIWDDSSYIGEAPWGIEKVEIKCTSAKKVDIIIQMTMVIHMLILICLHMKVILQTINTQI